MANHDLKIEDIKEDGIIETSIARSLGKVKKSLIVRADIINKEISFVVSSRDEEKIFDTIEKAVEHYNLVQ
jgi:hypothetical protein